MASTNLEDPPAYLTEGTEVSAKFKGAFCEAKIKKVDKIVKCKLTLKSSNESVTLNDHELLNSAGNQLTLNEFKQGNLVYFESSSSHLQAAILNKIIDQSVYTVVFNDDDEKCLKRSFIRFKGERHYLDSETLNNAPLNNPEHFLYPIKSSQSKQSPSAVSVQSNKANTTIGSVLNNSCSENESDLESVSNTTCTTTSIRKLGKQAGNIEDLHDENDDIEHENEDDEVVENEDSSSSDDYPPEEKDRFVAQLYKFMDDRGTPMNKVPCINKIDLDLHKFFIVVRKFGGFNKVTKQRLWSDVYKRLALLNQNAANIINLKCSYKRYLHPYEDFYRKLGSTMCDLISLRQTSASSSSRRSPLSKYKQKQLASSTSTSIDSKELNLTEAVDIKICVPGAPIVPLVSQTDVSVSNRLKQSISINDSIEETLNESQEKEFTIESLATSYSNIASSNASNTDDHLQQPQEELTLFGMVRNLNENYKKAKKQEKEKKLEETESLSCEKLPSVKLDSVKEDLKILKACGVAQKRPSSASQISVSKSKTRRSSLDKSSQHSKKSKSDTNQSENNEDYEEDEDEDDDEPKPKKKSNRLSLDLSEESYARSNKRKSSLSLSSKLTSNNEDESENERDKDKEASFKAGFGSGAKSNHVYELENKRCFKSTDLELNKIVEVRYGSGKTTYHAKIVQVNEESQTMLVHYLGWNNRYDEWIKIEKIIKIFSDDYGSCKRRKFTTQLKSNKPINLSHQLSTSSNDAQSPTLSNQGETFPKENGPKSKNFSSDTNESVKGYKSSQKLSKRSSLSSTSSSSSTNDQSQITKEEPIEPGSKTLTKLSETLKIPITTNKLRSSDSVSSNSSIELPLLGFSLSTSTTSSSICSSTPSAQVNTKRASSLELSAKECIKNETVVNEKTSLEDEFMLADPDAENEDSKKTLVQASITSLLSIKEEIIDFEAQIPQNENEKANEFKSSESIGLIRLLTEEIVSFALNQIEEDISESLDLVSKTGVDENQNSVTVGKKLVNKSNTDAKVSQTEPARQISRTSVKIKQVVESKNTNEHPEGTLLVEQQGIEIEIGKNVEKINGTKIKDNLDHDRASKRDSNNFHSEDFKENNAKTHQPIPQNINKNSIDKLKENEKDKECVSAVINTQKGVHTNHTEFKFPFHLIGCKFVGKQKIRFIEEQMRLCREEYAKLKNEIATIDRKKKKLKRNYLEKSSSNSNNANMNNNYEENYLNSSSSTKLDSSRKN